MKKTKRELFGTDGIRGKANIYPMTGELVMQLGRAVTHYFQRQNNNKTPLIIIGKDTRLSCYMLEQAFSSGVCSQGGRAILTGPMPTPGVAFATRSMRADAGVMISASHNNFSDNGIKIFDHTGNKLPDEVETHLEELVMNPDSIPAKTGADLGRAKRLDEVYGRYIVYVKSAFSNQYNLEGLRLVVDCANGASYKVAPMAFEELGAEVIPMFISPNGENINLNCGSMHPEAAAESVKRYRADLGICLDGDADRAVLIDAKGQVVDGDKIIGLLARFLKDTGEFKEVPEVVGTVMSNIGLEHYVRKLGLNFARTSVGDRYLVEHMQKSGAIFGAEPSGHMIFKKFSTTGDGILSALKLIECLRFYDRPLSDLVNDIELYPQVLENVPVITKPAFEQVPAIQKLMKEIEKDLGQKGRVLLRYSGTEPLARVMIEGEDEEKVTLMCKNLAHVVHKELGGQ